MQSFNLDNIYVEHLENYPSNIEIGEDAVTGWSSACLEEAINYYTDCNVVMQMQENTKE